ncbi:MAG: TauD/TfdA family dioxygenase [Comamonas sp.]
MSTLLEPNTETSHSPATAPATTPLALRRLAGALGAEVQDIRLSGELPQAAIDAIYQALLRHKVLFFRAQHHLDDEGQEAFARRFGALVPHPTQPVARASAILELDASRGGGRADSWHTDVTFVPAYPKLSILRGVVIPEFGGDTVWANTATAYANLPEPLQRLADGLWALHSNDYDYAANRSQVSEQALRHYKEVFTSTVFRTEHPLVHVHPETGERNLLLGHFVQRILGLTKAESDQIFGILQARTIRLENTVRWAWQAGDVAIWDNRATQHYAVNDYGDQPRVVRRVTIDGERATSIDGRRSIAR